MKRFHVHVGVADLNRSIEFYSSLFGAQPSVLKKDYAKWMLDDPRLNFAISLRPNKQGIDHLGIQAESNEELEALHIQLRAAQGPIKQEIGVNCCYAKSDKYWTVDPQGIAWETFHSLASVPVYGEKEEACCTPTSKSRSGEIAGCCA